MLCFSFERYMYYNYIYSSKNIYILNSYFSPFFVYAYQVRCVYVRCGFNNSGKASGVFSLCLSKIIKLISSNFSDEKRCILRNFDFRFHVKVIIEWSKINFLFFCVRKKGMGRDNVCHLKSKQFLSFFFQILSQNI
jgi:hypothetical protein